MRQLTPPRLEMVAANQRERQRTTERLGGHRRRRLDADGLPEAAPEAARRPLFQQDPARPLDQGEVHVHAAHGGTPGAREKAAAALREADRQRDIEKVAKPLGGMLMAVLVGVLAWLCPRIIPPLELK